MRDRLREIRARMSAWEAWKRVGTENHRDGLRSFEEHATEDIAWLLDEVERLRRLEVSHLRSLVRKMSWGLAWRASARKWRKRALMYERVKS